jgi:hypothetical protein
MPRSDAQRRAYAENVPQTRFAEPAPFIEEDLVGAQLYFVGLGLVLDYGYSFHGMDGQLYRGGVVRRKVVGSGVLIGSSWSWRANAMEVIRESDDNARNG